MRRWMFWRLNKSKERTQPFEKVYMEVDPDDEEITDAHITFSQEIERLIDIIATVEVENERLRLEIKLLKSIIKMGESKV